MNNKRTSLGTLQTKTQTQDSFDETYTKQNKKKMSMQQNVGVSDKINKRTSSIGNIKKPRVKWAKNGIQIIDVESYKKYNLENCHEDPCMMREKTRCNCIIF